MFLSLSLAMMVVYVSQSLSVSMMVVYVSQSLSLSMMVVHVSQSLAIYEYDGGVCFSISLFL